MISSEYVAQKKKNKELEILNSTEEEIYKMSYKDRQKYFHIKSKYGKIIHQNSTYKKKVKNEKTI